MISVEEALTRIFDLVGPVGTETIPLADAAGRYPVIDEKTADFSYCRLHGDEKLYESGYSDDSLDAWAARLRRRHGDIHAYFDNDVKVHAPFDARGLLDRLS